MLVVFLALGSLAHSNSVSAASPPQLQWQDNNCWMLSIVYLLWSMPELTDWIVTQTFTPGTPLAAYANLVKAIVKKADGGNHYAKELAALKGALERMLGRGFGGMSVPSDFFTRFHTILPDAKEAKDKLLDLFGTCPISKPKKVTLFEVQVVSLPQDGKLCLENLAYANNPVVAVPYLVFWFEPVLEKNIMEGKLVPLTIDVASAVKGDFEVCEYELVNIVVNHRNSHYTTYLKDGGVWYHSHNLRDTVPTVDDFVSKNKAGFWNLGNWPSLLLYKRTKLVVKKDPLQEALGRLSGSLTKLAEGLKPTL
jgi:hypothetical protein